MRGLSIRQPWAFAIAAGYKPIENRSRSTTYRGPLALHASLTLDAPTFPFESRSGRDAGRELERLGWREGFWDARTGGATGHRLLALGAVIAVAELADVCTTRDGSTGCGCGPWAVPGQCHWQLANVRPLARPLPWKGALGLWSIPDDAVMTHATTTADFRTSAEPAARGPSTRPSTQDENTCFQHPEGV